jgi:hypothetical protein
MKMTAFWDIALCSVCLHHQVMTEAVHTSEMLAHFYKTIRCYIPEGCDLHTCRHENLKSHSVCTFLQTPYSVFILLSVFIACTSQDWVEQYKKLVILHSQTVTWASLYLQLFHTLPDFSNWLLNAKIYNMEATNLLWVGFMGSLQFLLFLDICLIILQHPTFWHPFIPAVSHKVGLKTHIILYERINTVPCTVGPLSAQHDTSSGCELRRRPLQILFKETWHRFPFLHTDSSDITPMWKLKKFWTRS